MKKFISIIAIVLAALLCTVGLADSYYKVNANNVVVRVTPDKAGYKVGNVDQNTQVKKLGRSGSYTKVQIMSGKLKGKTGYIFSEYINKSGKNDKKAAKGLNKVTATVNLRSSAEKANNVIKRLSRGTKVTVKKINSRGWAQVVDSKGKTLGYVYATYLQYVGK